MGIVDKMLERIKQYEADLNELVTHGQTEQRKRIEETLLYACECLVSWDVGQDEVDFKEADAIVAFAFGAGPKNEPGRMNEGLAMFVEKLYKNGIRKPILAQWEIADVLEDKEIPVARRAILRGDYLNTVGVWDQMREYFWEQGMKRPTVILVAHPDHAFRCQKIIERFDVNVLVPSRDVLRKALKSCGCDDYGFDEESEQFWTRTRAAWVNSDLGSRMDALKRGKIFGPKEELFPFDSVNKYMELLEEALKPLSDDEKEELLHILRRLFENIFADLKEAEKGNPIEHHLIVLGHMMEIAKAENFSRTKIKRAASLSLLHDISAVEKITTQQVAELRKKNPEQADALELRRQQNRILHMREGSAMAHRRLLEVNNSLDGVVFDAKDIEAVCEVIRIHDNPSLDIPIPRQNWLTVAFREADRLWMITHEGIQADLERKGKNPENPQDCFNQLESNVWRFSDERCLYHPIEPSEGPFCDGETFFRTNKGYEIYQHLYKEGRKRYKEKSS